MVSNPSPSTLLSMALTTIAPEKVGVAFISHATK